ncbi:TIGR02556 family CRISPR-associated protein [Thermoanaerobacterium thermosaccharolyticum]|nr:TIGR02556 family CRISPR-associated protein [Thermoanaerobacterium thermosaccharolyticum]
MLEAIKEIGSVILKNGDSELLKGLTTEIEKSQNQQYIIAADIDTKSFKINFEIEELKDNSSIRYLWVGNCASSSFQWRVTTDKIEYLYSQCLPSLYERLNEGELKEKIKKILDNDIVSFSNNIGKRYRYVWDLAKMGIDKSFDVQELENNFKDQNNIEKKLNTQVTKIIVSYIKNKFNLGKGDEISLYTLKIDGKFVCDDKDYIDLILKEKISEIFENSADGICSCCGNKEKVIFDTKRFRFKYYNTNKISFSSYLTGKFDKNYNVCFNCYKDIMLGEVYIQNNLSTRIGGLPLYIIPGFIFSLNIDKDYLDNWSKYINYNVNTAASFSDIKDFEREIGRYINFESKSNNYILNLLFYRKNQQEFKVLKLIKDIPPTRVKEMIYATNKTKELGKRLLDDSKLWSIDLNKIYYLIPQRKSGVDLLEYSKLLEIYDSIFSRRPISRQFLIDKFVELIGIYIFGKYNLYNINNPGERPEDKDRGIIQSLLQANLLMHYLSILGNLKGGEAMDVNALDISQEHKEYINEMGYNEQQAAMFLFGCLISNVANAQYNEGHKNKPILDKLIYQGMNINKIMRLTTEVFEKLKQYKILSFNEGLFAQMKNLLDKNLNYWKLTDRENVFYILSGYSYNTYKILKSGKKENNKEVILNEQQ